MKAPNDRSFRVVCSENSFTGRFLRLPVTLLKENLEVSRRPLTYPEAIIKLILHVRYADQAEKVGSDQVICRRGESYLSLLAWSQLFHWGRTKTRVFFSKLRDQGMVEWESLSRTTRILILDYDFFVGAPYVEGVEGYPDDFENFWEVYHRTTRLLATDKQATYTTWRKLKESEREKATKNISKYFFSLAKTKYCVRALIYLRNKKFNDQFLPRC